jgi:hypothetical protein
MTPSSGMPSRAAASEVADASARSADMPSETRWPSSCRLPSLCGKQPMSLPQAMRTPASSAPDQG